MKRLDNFDLGHLREFSYVGEDLHRGTTHEIINIAVDSLTSERTNPLWCLVLAFLSSFFAFVACCVGRDEPAVLNDKSLPWPRAQALAIVFVILYSVLTTIADRRSQEDGKNTAFYVYIRYALSVPSFGFLIGVFCYDCGIKPEYVCPLFCVLQMAFYSMHWCHYFTRCFHEWFLQSRTLVASLLFFMIGTRVRGKGLSEMTIETGTLPTNSMMVIVVCGIFGCSVLFVMGQIICVMIYAKPHGRAYMFPPKYMLPLVFYVALCIIWCSSSFSSFSECPFFHIQCFIWVFSYISRWLITSDMLDMEPPLIHWPIFGIILCVINSFFNLVNPCTVTVCFSFLFFCLDLFSFFKTATSLRSYLIQHPETPLSFYHTD